MSLSPTIDSLAGGLDGTALLLLTAFLSHLARETPRGRLQLALGLGAVLALAGAMEHGLQVIAPAAGPGLHTLLSALSALAGVALLGTLLPLLQSSPLPPSRELAEARQTIARLQRCDELTGLLNHRHLLAALEEAFQKARRYDLPLSLILIDIDHFKAVNDRYGHATGDRVLSHVGGLLLRRLRDTDVAGRYGDAEFCIVLAHTALEDALVAAEKLRREILSTAVSDPAAGILHITCSMGVAELHLAANAQELLAHADRALAQAKIAGRDQVATMPPSNAP